MATADAHAADVDGGARIDDHGAEGNVVQARAGPDGGAACALEERVGAAGEVERAVLDVEGAAAETTAARVHAAAGHEHPAVVVQTDAERHEACAIALEGAAGADPERFRPGGAG